MTLSEHAEDYLVMRRSLGHRLERVGRLLGQFINELDRSGATEFTTDDVIGWATGPVNGSPGWHAERMSAVRGFARYLHSLDQTVPVPPSDVVCGKSRRATPFLYSTHEIGALIDATTVLRQPLRVVTYRTLIGLLSVTGMRVSEVIHLDTTDYDRDDGVLTIRHTKFDKSRRMPLHPTTQAVLSVYLDTRPTSRAPISTTALFISPAGTRLLQCNVESTFRLLVKHAGLQPRTGSCRPRMHDLRHSFAVDTLLDA